MLRENTAPGVTFPEWVDGRRLWIDPSVRDMIDVLHNGDPVLGWEGDPRLALYLEDGAWCVYRYEADGEMRPVCRSRPGLALDARLIRHLQSHDQRRGFDLTAFSDTLEKPASPASGV